MLVMVRKIKIAKKEHLKLKLFPFFKRFPWDVPLINRKNVANKLKNLKVLLFFSFFQVLYFNSFFYILTNLSQVCEKISLENRKVSIF